MTIRTRKRTAKRTNWWDPAETPASARALNLNLGDTHRDLALAGHRARSRNRPDDCVSGLAPVYVSPLALSRTRRPHLPGKTDLYHSQRPTGSRGGRNPLSHGE